MQTITKHLVLLALLFSMQLIHAQDTIPAIKNQKNIEMLERVKTEIIEEEKKYLKQEVEAINRKLDNGDITLEEAEKLKMEVAKKTALNIENLTAIADNKIALLKRNSYGISRIGEEHKFGIVINDIPYGIRKDKNEPKKYDKRTTSDFVLAFGFNNAIIEGESLDDSPYKFGGSRFFEIGTAWKTRVFDNSNFMRLKYGVSLQINGLKPTDNYHFVQQGNQTVLENFPYELKKVKLSVSNLVFPVHLEFGPSKKIEKDNYMRYSTSNKFKIGLGGYGGFNIGTRQKLKYEIDGERTKEKQKRGFNTTNLVYGVSGYIAFDDTALYVKYDLSPIFNDQAIKQNNISIGVRFDMD
ncbi:hypothetical protein [Confluentibacter flavum]|uniref:Outer membrane protein beta-barrel domain-containing protein n=1 Tax=Confluentibacter flavum TaxID=1909700 RepID=A0A2N3HNF2_9FLAO|nr:hypothetical protein [Confluentibacter flavum]PKQ46486.1 hypothetical protein CSW08_02860 [Confluentibacter flavum]